MSPRQRPAVELAIRFSADVLHATADLILSAMEASFGHLVEVRPQDMLRFLIDHIDCWRRRPTATEYGPVISLLDWSPEQNCAANCGSVGFNCSLDTSGLLPAALMTASDVITYLTTCVTNCLRCDSIGPVNCFAVPYWLYCPLIGVTGHWRDSLTVLHVFLSFHVHDCILTVSLFLSGKDASFGCWQGRPIQHKTYNVLLLYSMLGNYTVCQKIYEILSCSMVFTIRLGSCNVSVSVSSRIENVSSRSRLRQNSQCLGLGDMHLGSRLKKVSCTSLAHTPDLVLQQL